MSNVQRFQAKRIFYLEFSYDTIFGVLHDSRHNRGPLTKKSWRHYVIPQQRSHEQKNPWLARPSFWIQLHPGCFSFCSRITKFIKFFIYLTCYVSKQANSISWFDPMAYIWFGSREQKYPHVYESSIQAWPKWFWRVLELPLGGPRIWTLQA